MTAKVAVVAGPTTSKAVRQQKIPLVGHWWGAIDSKIPSGTYPCEPTQKTKNQKNGLQATWQPATWIGIRDMEQFCDQLLSATRATNDSDSLQQASQALAHVGSLWAHHHHHHPTLSVAPLQCSAELLQGPRLPSLPWMFEVCLPEL